MKKADFNCGIYQIRNLINGKCYVGQSIHLKSRKNDHLGDLRRNQHHNPYLQSSFNKHGETNFIFEILIYCIPEKLTYYEQLFCDINKAHGLSYNIRECVESNRGIKLSPETIKKMCAAQSGKNNPNYGKLGKDNPNYGRTHSPETIEKMSKAHKNENNPMWGVRLCGKLNGMYGKTPSLETKKKMRMSKIFKKEIILRIIKYLDKGLSQKEIAENLKISKSVVSRASRGFYNEIYSLPSRKWVKSNALKKETILQTKKLLKKKISGPKIARELGINIATVYKIRNGFYDD